EMSVVGELLGRYPMAVRRARGEHEQPEDGNGNQQFDQRKALAGAEVRSATSIVSTRHRVSLSDHRVGGCPPPLMRKSLGRTGRERLRRIA
ncbi:MAG TPA: hypothetical protein VGP14_07135, partial [Casimicrobiaceae bacterium]|nr:hypothetical protein [Casimicrobiaceae bacterium]